MSTFSYNPNKLDITSTPPTICKSLRYFGVDSNTGGVARGTSVTNAAWVDVFSKTGAGNLYGFVLNIESKDKWQIRLVVDGEEIFSSDGLLTTDIINDSIWDLDNYDKEMYDGIGLHFGEHDKLMWHGPLFYPVCFESSVSIKLKRQAGESSKLFRAILVTAQIT